MERVEGYVSKRFSFLTIRVLLLPYEYRLEAEKKGSEKLVLFVRLATRSNILSDASFDQTHAP